MKRYTYLSENTYCSLILKKKQFKYKYFFQSLSTSVDKNKIDSINLSMMIFYDCNSV